MMSSAAGLWKLFRDQAERGSGIGLKLFGFIAESVFTIIPESCSGLAGMAFGIIQESCSACSGFLIMKKSKSAIGLPKPDAELIPVRLRRARQFRYGGLNMAKIPFEKSSGNVLPIWDSRRPRLRNSPPRAA